MKQEDAAVQDQANPGNEAGAPEMPAEGDAPTASAHETVTDEPEPPAQAPLRARLGGMIKTRQQRMAVYTVIAALAGLAMAWFFAALLPNYLLYATPAIKADAVVLFLGPGEEARRKQVDALVAGKMAKFVIVPYEGRIFETWVSKAPVNPAKTTAISRGIRVNTQRSYVERTHIEVLQARALLELVGATSANFVSSPYHMRRIKIMAGKVFDADQYQIAFVPAVTAPRHVPWFLAWRDVQWVFSEWGKIVWYFMYSPFV